ncbi:uncharacterized protein LOC117223075 [Megalopta genalis]|uniref:uncharacterized protein LOC117223075 n=1 Tax=Megalopta genalis TaxID=115081 RepID=UPI003FD4E92E
MAIEGFNCDISLILQNRDFTVLESLVSGCKSFYAKIAAKEEDGIAYETECKEKRALRINKITELQQQSEILKSEIDATKLQQKIVEKKISNATKQLAILTEKVDNAKLQRDGLSLEIVDLQQDHEQRNEQKVLLWNAIKRACHAYKNYLDFCIYFPDGKDYEHVQISFFTNNTNLTNEYFVLLTNSNNRWNVEKIQPVLEKEYYNDFKGIVDFSTESEIVDITLFLCRLRDVFVMHYLNSK